MAHWGVPVDPYTIHMTPQTSVTVHISTLQAAMTAHMQDPFSEFHDVNNRARRLLWSLPLEAPWGEFRQRYYDYMVTGNPGPDAERFQALGPWYLITRELSVREELEFRSISYDVLPFIFPALPAPAAQGPPPPPQSPVPQPPAPEQAAPEGEGLDDVHIVFEVPPTPEIVLVDSGEGLEEGMGEHDPLNEELGGHGGIGEDEDPEMEDESEDDGDDDADPDYDPTRDR